MVRGCKWLVADLVQRNIKWRSTVHISFDVMKTLITTCLQTNLIMDADWKLYFDFPSHFYFWDCECVHESSDQIIMNFEQEKTWITLLIYMV